MFSKISRSFPWVPYKTHRWILVEADGTFRRGIRQTDVGAQSPRAPENGAFVNEAAGNWSRLFREGKRDLRDRHSRIPQWEPQR